MDDEEENTDRKPISYFTEFRLDINANVNNFVRKLCPAEGKGGERRGGELKCYRQADRQTDRHIEPPTKRGS